ncbi:hypothetical protein BY996DRAFT_4587417 [Phakopsora pachyrhizi]|nr:hypothetical protein BY996DRAFT_4587417 [Phakopsora pachyrhizi]
MPSNGYITCNLVHGHNPNSLFRELAISHSENSIICHTPLGENPNISGDYGPNDIPYAIHWSISPSLLRSSGIHVQVEVDGCQKGQPRCYEELGSDCLMSPSPINGMDDGLWVVPDGTRRRPWVMGEIKTTHPHSALSDKYILDRVGSVTVTFSKAKVVPTSHVVPLVPVFTGSAPLPERMRAKVSHWTKLGFIEKHQPAPELGLVSEEIGDRIISITFYYRSQELLERIVPQVAGSGNADLSIASDIRFSFPTSPNDIPIETRSARSAEFHGSYHSNQRSSSSRFDRPVAGFRRALSSVSPPRHSFDDSMSGEKPQKKPEGSNKLTKLGGKRVRAVSLRVAKRYSLLGNKSGEKVKSSNAGEAEELNSPTDNGNENLYTIDELRKEVLELRVSLCSCLSIKNS